MSPRKLTAEDKDEILELYRQPQETTSTLADRFSVSSSTISRFLKSRLNEGEYEELIQQKRLSRTPSGAAQVMNEFQKQERQLEIPEPGSAPPATTPVFSSAAPPPLSADPSDSSSPTIPAPAPQALPTDGAALAADPFATIAATTASTSDGAIASASPDAAPVVVPTRRAATSRRRRSSAPPVSEPLASPVITPEPAPAYLATPAPTIDDPPTPAPIPSPLQGVNAAASPLPQPLSTNPREDLEDEEDEVVHALEEMLGEDIDLDEDEDEDWDDEEDEDDGLPLSTGDRASEVRVLPLKDAHFPRTCYLVIDRAAELITHPLQDFQDLGSIPGSEAAQRTLPVFDNHRVARRFSKRTQRVIKVPDSELFTKTRTYLQARGITRLLLDGQVYAL